jgi:hypothetical protein
MVAAQYTRVCSKRTWNLSCREVEFEHRISCGYVEGPAWEGVEQKYPLPDLKEVLRNTQWVEIRDDLSKVALLCFATS